MTANESFHEVGFDDHFFSTTDHRGVIQQANALFVEYSRYPRDRVIGAPHNLIRSPRMPGAAFATMWQALEQGRPFAGYIHNRAADGSLYTVFATVTPLPDGYLSVRVRPSCEDRLAAVDKFYAVIAAHEAERIRGGATRREAAMSGARLLNGLLAEEGYDSYERFQWDALPGEMSRHLQLSSGFPDRPHASGRLGVALARMREFDAELSTWLGEQEHLASLTRGLRRAARRLQHELDRTDTASAKITGAASTPDAKGVPGAAEEPGSPFLIWAQMQGIVRGYIVDLITTLTELQRHSAETRFRLALAQLHSSTMSRFLAELLDGAPGAAESTPAIRALTTALGIALREMRCATERHRELSEHAAAAIERTRGVMSIPRQLLLVWQADGPSSQPSEGDGDLPDRVAEAIAGAGSALDELARTAERCAAFDLPHDTTKLAEILMMINDELRHLAQEQNPGEEVKLTAEGHLTVELNLTEEGQRVS